jgi:hypothetical protein
MFAVAGGNDEGFVWSWPGWKDVNMRALEQYIVLCGHLRSRYEVILQTGVREGPLEY